MRLNPWLLAALMIGACGDDDDDASMLDGAIPDAASASDAAVDADAGPAVIKQPADCSLDPHSYLELINACTDAEKIEKKPSLPLLNSDGTLPPLP